MTLSISEQGKFTFAISYLFLDVFKELYPGICDISSLIINEISKRKRLTQEFWYVVGHDNPFRNAGTKLFKAKIFATMQKSMQYTSFNHSSHRLIKTTYTYSLDKLCLRKLAMGVVPNFVHHLDSVLLYKSVLEVKALGIPLSVAHDCFYLNKKHKELIQSIYFEIFIEEILHKNVYENFLYLNDITDSNWVRPPTISMSDYKMSPFILS